MCIRDSSAIDCLERLLSEMTCYVSYGKLFACLLVGSIPFTYSVVQFYVFIICGGSLLSRLADLVLRSLKRQKKVIVLTEVGLVGLMILQCCGHPSTD